MADVVSRNLVNLVNDQIGNQLLGQIRSVLGNEGPKASTAVDSFVPAMLAGVTNLADSSSGAETLFHTMISPEIATLSQFHALVREGQISAAVDQGRNLLGILFGPGGVDKLGYVLSAYTGVSLGNTTSMMGILATVIIGVIKREFMGQVANANELASAVQQQKLHVDAAMPSGLLDQLQSSGFVKSISGKVVDDYIADDFIDEAEPDVSGTARQVRPLDLRDIDSRPHWASVVIPIVGLVVLAWLAIEYL